MAKKWACNKYNRIKEEVLEHAEALIMACRPQNVQPQMTVPQNMGTQTVQDNTTQTEMTEHSNTIQTQTNDNNNTEQTTIQMTHSNKSIGTMTDPWTEWPPTGPVPQPTGHEQRTTCHPNLGIYSKNTKKKMKTP